LGIPDLIGLDIGTTAVKAARIRRKGTRTIVLDLADVPIDAAGRGAGSGDEATSAAMRQCLKRLKGRTGAVACGLSGPDVIVRPFDFPAMPAHQLASAVELEAAQVCPFDVAESAVAYDVLAGRVSGRVSRKNKSQRTTGVFAAAKNVAVERLRELCRQGGTRCVLVDVEGLALINCLEACGAIGTGMAMVLNVGGSYTNLAILSENGQPFVRDIAYGSEAIVDHVCRVAGAPRQAVVDALTGAEGGEASMGELLPGLEEACSMLADRVHETLRYHGTMQSGPSLEKTSLCGGLARAKAVVDVLTPLLPGNVELWNPLVMLLSTRAVRKSGMVEQGTGFAVALGLAMRSLRDV
jgi:type IV pilus assembly protein PilM